MKYTIAPLFEEQRVDQLCTESSDKSISARGSSIRSFSINSSILVLMICMLMISTTVAQRFGPQRILQSSQIEDETFKTRVYCPYSFFNRSIELINNSNLTAPQKQVLLANHHLTTTENKYPDANFTFDKIVIIEVRSIEVRVNVTTTLTNGSNTTAEQVRKNLYYCGLSRSFYKTCQEDVKYTCTIPGSMFETIRYQYVDVAFVNLLNPRIVPNAWEDGVLSRIKLCMDITLQQQVCTMYEKKNNLQTFSDPLAIHNYASMPASHSTTASSTYKEKDDLNHVRIQATNWPLSPHIHGLQIRPTMDGHPESWISNAGTRGAGAFSSQDQCYYDAFDHKDSYTTKQEPADGYAATPLIIKDKMGFDVTFLAKINRYPNAQNPGTLWYHDHAMRLTNFNAISGLAGFYLIRNPVVQAEINVPKENEIFFLVSQALNWQKMASSKIRGGQVYRVRFLQDLPDSHHKLHFTHGSCANTSEASKIPFTLIGTDGSLFHHGIENLKQITIASGQRLQLLIMPNSNFTTFEFCSHQLQFNWLSNEPGFSTYVTLEEQLAANHILQYPVNMSRVNTIPIPMAPARPGTSPYTGRTSISNVTLSVSYQNLNLVPFEQIKVRKMRPLSFQFHGHHLFTISGRSDFHKGFTQFSEIGTTQDYYFINYSGVPHPMHFHLVNFQIVKQYQLRAFFPSGGLNHLDNCTYYEVDFITQTLKLLLRSETSLPRLLKYHLKRIFRNNMQIVNIEYLCNTRQYLYQEKIVQKYFDLVFPQDGEAHPTTKVHGLDLYAKATATDVLNGQSIYNVTVGDYKYITGNGTTRVRPEHTRWKDTAMVKATRVYVFRVRWTKNDYEANSSPPDTYFNIPMDQLREYPGFVYHCHIIHHEDYEMMRGFMMTLPKSLAPAQTLDRQTPCNYNVASRKYTTNWADKAKCINKRCDAWSKTQTSNA